MKWSFNIQLSGTAKFSPFFFYHAFMIYMQPCSMMPFLPSLKTSPQHSRLGIYCRNLEKVSHIILTVL